MVVLGKRERAKHWAAIRDGLFGAPPSQRAASLTKTSIRKRRHGIPERPFAVRYTFVDPPELRDAGRHRHGQLYFPAPLLLPRASSRRRLLEIHRLAIHCATTRAAAQLGEYLARLHLVSAIEQTSVSA